jgi:HD-GYP domain-containing protein (c-di-GMP phosphodiesterase class II)
MAAPAESQGVSFLLDTIKSLEKRSACLLEVARFVREIHDFHELLGRILAKSAELVGADAGVIALADPASGEFKFVNVHYASLPALEAGDKEEMLGLIRLKLSDGIIGEVYASGEPRVVSDLSSSSVFRKDVSDTVGYETKNLMAVPLTAEGDKLGVLEFLNKMPDGPFSPGDVDLASAMANQIALVVEAHRLREAAGGKAGAADAEAARLRAEKEEKEAALAGLRKEKDGADGALAGLRKEKEAAEAAAETLRKEAEALRKEAESLRREKESAEKARADAETRAVSQEKEAETLRRAAGDKDARLKAAEEAAAKAREAAEAALRAKENAVRAMEEATRGMEDARLEAKLAAERNQRLTEDLETAFRLHEKTQRKSEELVRALEDKKNDSRPQDHQRAMMKAFAAVSSSQPTDMVLDALLDAVATVLDAEAASLLLAEESTGLLYFAAATGGKKDPLKKVMLKEGEGIAGWVAQNGKVLNIPDVGRDPRFSSQADKSADFVTRSVLAVPLFAESRLIGVAEAVNKKGGAAFSEDDAQTLIALSLYGAMAIRKAQIYWDMNELFLSTVRTLADAMETKGAGGRGCAERVRRLTLALAAELSVPGAFVRDLEIAALLQDVGKIILPEKLLHSTDELTEDEGRLLARAPVVAAEILSDAKPLRNVVPLVRHVHERWDGQGHPDRLKGEDIPLGSRIISTAVTYEAMTADRPHRRRLPEEVAVKEIQSLRGVQLDPAAVDALVRLYRKGKLKDLFK